MGDKKKPKKSGGDEGLTRAMKKMLMLKQAAANKGGSGRKNSTQHPQQAQQQRQDRQERVQPAHQSAQAEQPQQHGGQQPEPARGHEEPAAPATQQRAAGGAQQGQQGQQAKLQQRKQGPDSLFQQKRLKVGLGVGLSVDGCRRARLRRCKVLCIWAVLGLSVAQPTVPYSRLAWSGPTNPAVACCRTQQDRKKEYLKQKKLKKKGKGAEPLLTEKEAALAARTAATAPRLGEVSWEGGWC